MTLFSHVHSLLIATLVEALVNPKFERPQKVLVTYMVFCFKFIGESFILSSLFFQDEYQLVRDCLCGQMYDSSPVDFVSDLGTRFILHPSVLKLSEPPRVLSWTAKGVASGLDTLFISKFEEQRKEYWETLYSSVVCSYLVTKNFIS